jgi:hypothetical protein
MTLLNEPARISLVAGSAATTCELCTEQSVTPTTTIVITHPRGGMVQLGACDWCIRAIRRLAAVSGGQATFVITEASGLPPSASRSAPPARSTAPAVLIRELTQELEDSAGTLYIVRVFGRERIDGTWEGFLEFVAVGAAIVLQTGTETTQSNREDLVYWASGLNTGYLQGAFQRARPVDVAR